MRKLLLAAVAALLVLSGSAQAGHDARSYNEWLKQMTPECSNFSKGGVEPLQPGDPIGWVKATDIDCGEPRVPSPRLCSFQHSSLQPS